MIQFKRGKSDRWNDNNPVLTAGQPGYDKTENKLKIGDGTSKWKDLDYVIGDLDIKRLIQAETSATSKTVFTYGEKAPNNNTKGMIYLQQCNGGVEADYVIETGRNTNYFFRKWNSGLMECWGTGEISDSATSKFKTILFKVQENSCFEIKGYWN